jgi:UDP:flavonoid glycosyltransferase YjiC (YdhE family)
MSVMAVVSGGLDIKAPNLVVHADPVMLDRVRFEATLGVTHSPVGTGAGFLCAGTPVLLLPKHAEQRILAFGLRRARLAAVLGNEEPTLQLVTQLVEPLIGGNKAPRAVRRFAKRYGDVGPNTAVERGAARLIEALSRRG